MQEIDVLYIFDKDDNFINTVSNISEYVYKKQTNGIGELKISSPINSDLIKYNKVGFWNGDEFCLFEIDTVDSDIYVDEEICEVIALEDVITLRDNMIEERRMRDATIRQGLEKALEGTKYGIGHVDDNKELRTYNYYFNNSLECLNIVLKEYVMEFVARVELKENNRLEKFIDVYFRVGRDTGLRFTYDINLQLLERSESNSPHFNVLYGFGKSLETENGGFSRKLTFDSVNNGKKYIEDIESIAKYGKRIGKFEDGKIEDVNELLQATKAKLKEVKDLQYTYKATVKEVSDFLNFEHFDISNGDYAIIADEERNSIFKARVAEVTYIKDSRGVLNKNFVFGALSHGLFDDSLEDKFNDLNDRLDYIQNQKPEIPPIDEQYPNAVPPRSKIRVKGLYSSIAIEWSFENKSYFWYELYASKQNNFVPQPTDLIFKGQASAYLHQVAPGETWYYRVRCVNSYGATNEFSTQVTGHSFKVSDGTEFFENASIVHALIQSVDADTITVGKLKGQRIDAKELSVEDGNGNQTLYIDSWGNVILNVKQLKILGKEVIQADEVIKKINDAIKEFDISVNSRFDDANQSLSDLEGYMEGAFYDGVINASEAKSLRGLLERLEQERLVTNKEFDNIHYNKYLDQDHKNILFNVKQIFNVAILEYTEKINQVILNETVSDEDRAELDALGGKYRGAIEKLKDALTQCVDNITAKRVEELDYTTTEHFVEIQTDIDGINNTVKKNTVDIVNIDGEVQKKLSKSEFTEYKQNEEGFKWKIEQQTNIANIVPNGDFMGGGRCWVSSCEFWAGDYSAYDFNRARFAGIRNPGTTEQYLYMRKPVRVKRNTTYTLSFNFICEKNISSMEVFIMYCNNENVNNGIGNYEKAEWKYEMGGGKQSAPGRPVTMTFNTGEYDYIWVRFDHNGMKQGVNVNEYCWLYIGEVAIYEGDVGIVKYIPHGSSNYTTELNFDYMGFYMNFNDGRYIELKKETGLVQKVGNMEHPYHCLGWAKAVGIPAGNPGKVNVRLPDEFDHCSYESINWSVAQRGYYFSTTGSFFPFYVQVEGARLFKHTDGHWYVEVHGYSRIQNANNPNDVQNMPNGINAMITVNA